LYYYPQNKSKFSSAYPPEELSPVKSKFRQCIMEWFDSVLLWRTGTEYCSNQWKW